MGYAYDESPFVPLRTTTSGNSRPTEAMQDAEIAKLRGERAIHLASIAEHSQQLAAARAALDGEREACDSWRSMFVLIPADCADSVPLAEFNGPNHREHGAIGAACKTHDARRAAEAKGLKS